MKIWTWVFLETWVFAEGEVRMTLPTKFGSSVSSSTQVPVRAFAVIWAVASSQLLVTTSGIVAFSSAFATVRVTVVPFSTSSPRSGFCSMTVPGSSPLISSSTSTTNPYFSPSSSALASSMLSPITLGTATFGAPVDTTRLMVSPFSTLAPAAGSCSQTLPLTWSSQGFSVKPNSKSLFAASFWASALVSPTKLGAATVLLSTLSPLIAHRPIRTAPIRTRTPATTSNIVLVLFFFCGRR